MSKIKHILRSFILHLIQRIEAYENMGVDMTEKLIESYDIEKFEIQTDKGFKPISFIHKTKPFSVFRVELQNGYFIDAADNHIVFDSMMSQVFVKNLRSGDFIQTDVGLQRVISITEYSPSVCMYDVTVDSDDHRFYGNGVLSHNTTTIAAYFAWYLCFHTDRNLAILANKQATTFEIVNKVTDVFKGLPFFLKPGILSIGAGGMRLDNGCMLTSQATTKTAAIGFAIHVLYIDEFAHIQQNIARDFWRSVYPTLSSSQVSQCIISSTPYGQDNLFFELWDGAVTGKNDFTWKRVDYWEVPGHDEEWAKKMKRNFGEDEFAQEFELKFDIKANNLLDGSNLSWMKRLSKMFSYRNVNLDHTSLDSELYENLQWRNDFNPNGSVDKKNERYVLTVDIAEGKDIDEKKDSDYNIASVHKVKLKSLAKLRKLRKDEHRIENLFRLEQVGLYRDNVKDVEALAKVSKAIVFDQLGPDVCKMVVEMNFNGKAFMMEFSNHDEYSDELVMHTYHTAPVPGEKLPRKKAGFKVGSDKDHFVKLGKRLIDRKTILVTEEETYYEFNAFGKSKDGKYKGIARHDDIAMSVLNLSRLYQESEYSDWLYDFLESMSDCPEKRLAMEILKEPYDEEDLSDDLFKAMYEDDVENNIREIFNKSSEQYLRYKPGRSF